MTLTAPLPITCWYRSAVSLPALHTGHRENPRPVLIPQSRHCSHPAPSVISSVHGTDLPSQLPPGKGLRDETAAAKPVQHSSQDYAGADSVSAVASRFRRPSVFAQQKAPSPDSEVSVAIGSGLHFFNVSGYRGKVGEYEVLKSGADSTFPCMAIRGKTILI